MLQYVPMDKDHALTSIHVIVLKDTLGKSVKIISATAFIFQIHQCVAVQEIVPLTEFVLVITSTQGNIVNQRCALV